jgi:hypothetical protein
MWNLVAESEIIGNTDGSHRTPVWKYCGLGCWRGGGKPTAEMPQHDNFL